MHSIVLPPVTVAPTQGMTIATITKITRKGGVVYRAQIRRKKGGKVTYTEARTFSRERLATDWARRRELELEHPGAMERARAGDISIAGLIDWYIRDFRRLSDWGRTKQTSLEQLRGTDIAQVAATELTTQSLIDHVRKRREGGAGPATAMNDLVWLGVVMRAAKSVRRLPVQPAVVAEARQACHELRQPGPITRIVNLRVVMPIPTAQALAAGLYDFLKTHGHDPVPKPPPSQVQ